jgi:hypothetical protein
MKRMHVHVAVEDLQHSIGFYSALCSPQPVVKPDYAKWMLDDRVNFAISTRGRRRGSIISASGRRDDTGDIRVCAKRAAISRTRPDRLLREVRKSRGS